jgi:hypothetical protein
MWRVKIVEDEELSASPIQEVEVFQEEIATHEVCITNKIENRLMTRAATFQWLFSILHPKSPFWEMCQRVVH